MKTEALVLADDKLRLDFCALTGALTGMTALETGWKVLDRPRLGLAFKLLVPKGRRRNNPVDGERQRVSAVERAADLMAKVDGTR